MGCGRIDKKTSSFVMWSGCIDENKMSACAMDVLMKTRVSIGHILPQFLLLACLCLLNLLFVLFCLTLLNYYVSCMWMTRVEMAFKKIFVHIGL